MLTIKTIYPLSFKSKEVLYNFLLFYNLSFSLPEKILKENKVTNSFKKTLLNQPISGGEGESAKNFLARAQVVCVNNAFLYLDLGRKFNLVKPKFRNNFKDTINKEFLFSFEKTFQFCTITNIRNILSTFQYRSIKTENFALSLGKLHLKCLLLESSKKLAKFFFIKLKRHFFSNYQKKVNFFQFNILFKKYKY